MGGRTFPTGGAATAHLANIAAQVAANAPKATIIDRTPQGYGPSPKGDQNGASRSMRHEARARAGMQDHAAGASGGHGGGNPNHDEQGRFT